MSREMDRKVFLKRAGLSTVAAGSLPVLLGTEGAFGASPSSGQRAYEFVALSQAPAPADGRSGRGRVQTGCRIRPRRRHLLRLRPEHDWFPEADPRRRGLDSDGVQ